MARRTIIARLTRVESSREQPGAKTGTNVIKDDERSDDSRKEKGRQRNQRDDQPQAGVKIKVGLWKVRKIARLQNEAHVLLSGQKKADPINKKCQPFKTSCAGQLRKVATFPCRTPAAVRTERKGDRRESEGAS